MKNNSRLQAHGGGFSAEPLQHIFIKQRAKTLENALIIVVEPLYLPLIQKVNTTPRATASNWNCLSAAGTTSSGADSSATIT